MTTVPDEEPRDKIHSIVESLILDIIDALRQLPPTQTLGDKPLAAIIRKHNKSLAPGEKHHAKKWLLPYFHTIKSTDPGRWRDWRVDPLLERRLTQTLQMKPRRNASGVTTVTVITKPWRCSNDCLYCPSDVRMPRSYLSDEPACQRAEQNYFDPYLQVRSRLGTLRAMGHVTDKIELIVLGGTWSDYPLDYQTWFVKELYRALNDGEQAEARTRARREFYESAGLSRDKNTLNAFAQDTQAEVDNGAIGYNQAIMRLYLKNDVWRRLAATQTATLAELEAEHRTNETTQYRVVGLSLETRPDRITAEHLTWLRRLGCTKVQIGIQSLNQEILKMNNRTTTLDTIRSAFDLLRLFGFKVHTHFMLNLYGSSPEEDVIDYRRLVTEQLYLPDEVKLYPCSLVKGTKLCARHADGTWRPYTDEELSDVLTACVLDTPSFTRISRMVRDISAQDIVAGNTKSNFRETVEERIKQSGMRVAEMRFREISTDATPVDSLRLDTVPYETNATDEHFLQWVTPEGKIAGFLRLSLPKQGVSHNLGGLPINESEAMIREVHVYGRATALLHDSNQESGEPAGLKNTDVECEVLGAGSPQSEKLWSGTRVQHLGLGKQLIEAACQIARDQGFTAINVISSVGTREYYRNLGFIDGDLYQQLSLT